MRRALLISVVALVLLVVAVTAVWRNMDSIRAFSCTYGVDQHDGIACLDSLLIDILKREGVKAAINALGLFAQEYPRVYDSGQCHLSAHALGDAIYYKTYLNDPDFALITFPPDSNVCTFGVLHGFFMHLIQDHPDASFIESTCTYFGSRFGNTVENIETNGCYHGAGHGLLLANITRITITQHTDPAAIVRAPVATCGLLPDTGTDRMECYMGAFSELVSDIRAHSYGLSFNDAAPFSFCGSFSGEAATMCYNQVADAYFGDATDMTMDEILSKVGKIPDMQHRRAAFVEAVLGRTYKALKDDTLDALVGSCAKVPSDLFETCVGGLANGVFNSGTAERMLPRAVAMCESASMARINGTEICFRDAIENMHRLLTSSQLATQCDRLPESYRATCREPSDTSQTTS